VAVLEAELGASQSQGQLFSQELAGLKHQLAGPAMCLREGVDKMTAEMAVMERERLAQVCVLAREADDQICALQSASRDVGLGFRAGKPSTVDNSTLKA